MLLVKIFPLLFVFLGVDFSWSNEDKKSRPIDY